MRSRVPSANRSAAATRLILLDEKPVVRLDLPAVTLTTDGAADRSQRGSGGWAFVLRCDGRVLERSGRIDAPTTSQRAELEACLQGLMALKSPCALTLISDSQYLIQGVSVWMRNWKRRNWATVNNKPVANVDQWKRIDALIAQHDVICQWVKGHAGADADQSRCDTLAEREVRTATAMAALYREGPSCSEVSVMRLS